MPITPRIAWGVILLWTGAMVYGQRPPPIADQVEVPLLPSGIAQRSAHLSGELAYLFDDPDGTETVHVVGDFLLKLGEDEGPELRSHEAVVWITHRLHAGRAYRHLQLLLWRDAEILESGGTVTSGPALFVTLDTFGQINLNVDDLTLQSSAETLLYQKGNRIRKALAEGTLRGADEDVSLRVFDASGLSIKAEEDKSRPLIHFEGGRIEGPKPADGQRVITAIGGVYLARGLSGSTEYIEIQADAAVVFLPPQDQPTPEEPAGPGLGAEGDNPSATAGHETTPPPPQSRVKTGERQLMAIGVGTFEVEAVYLEGDIRMTQGPNLVRATRLYYDFTNDRAIILDAVVRTTIAERNIPLYMRAAQVRQLAAGRYAANDAILTTSEFYTPHYHIGAAHVELINRTPPGPGGRPVGLRAGSFRIRHSTLNLGGRPIAYWPYISGRIDTSETAIQRMRSGFSDDFGLELETDWHLFNLVGLETPDGFDATMSLDFYSRRGPAIGVDADYEGDRYYGLLKSYFLTDADEDFLGRRREEQSRREVRGRLLARHRQFLQDDWQLTFELSYISDKGFLEEFFETEFDNDKQQETLVYLKKQRDNWALTGSLQWRILDFTTATERLPDFSFHLEGQPLGKVASWFSENRVGIVRYRPADQTFRELLRDGRTVGSQVTRRIDTRQEVGFPLDWGPVRLVPFVTARGTGWDDSPDKGSVARALGTVGLRGSMYLWRVYPEARSSVFDIDGLRHVIKPDITAWVSGSNLDSHELFPFDHTVEAIDDVDGVAVGVRQRWQTKRGAMDNRRTVDVITLDTELGFFNDAASSSPRGRRKDRITNGYASFSRPEGSIAHNYFNTSFIWRANDRTALLSELNYDVNDGEVDVFNLSLAVERTPRLSYLLGYRFIEESDSNLLGFDLNYRLTEKHTLALRELFDLDRGQPLDFTVVLIRKFPRWFGAIAFELDQPEDDFGVSLAIWPEGLPQVGVGSRRFTGLANTTRIRRD